MKSYEAIIYLSEVYSILAFCRQNTLEGTLFVFVNRLVHVTEYYLKIIVIAIILQTYKTQLGYYCQEFVFHFKVIKIFCTTPLASGISQRYLPGVRDSDPALRLRRINCAPLFLYKVCLSLAIGT